MRFQTALNLIATWGTSKFKKSSLTIFQQSTNFKFTDNDHKIKIWFYLTTSHIKSSLWLRFIFPYHPKESKSDLEKLISKV